MSKQENQKAELTLERITSGLMEVDELISEGELYDALDIINHMAKSYPNLDQVLLKKIEICSSLGIHSKETLSILETLHSNNPSDIDIWLLLVGELSSFGLFALAEKEIELILSSAEGFSADEDTNDFITDIRQISASEREHIFNDSERLQLIYNLAEKSLLNANLDKAIQFAEELYTGSIDNLAVLVKASQIFYSSGEFKRAKSIAEEIISSDNSFSEAFEIAAFSARSLGEPVKNFPLPEESLFESENSRIGSILRYLLLSGNENVIVSIFEKFEDSILSHPEAYEFLEALAFIEFRRGNRELAIEHWQRAALLEQDDSTISRLNLEEIEQGEEDADAGFYFYGPHLFPAFFNREIVSFAESDDLSYKTSLTAAELPSLPNLAVMAIEFGDSNLVNLAARLALSVARESNSKNIVLTELKKITEGYRLSPFERMECLSILREHGFAETISIYFRNRKLNVPLIKMEEEPVDLDVFLAAAEYGRTKDTQNLNSSEMSLIIQKYLEAGDFETVRTLALKAIISDPGNLRAYVDYLRSLKILGLFDEVEEHIDPLRSLPNKSTALQAFIFDFDLPESIDKGRYYLSSINIDEPLTEQDLRELQILRSSIFRYDDNEEEADNALDILELYIPNSGPLVREIRFLNSSSKTPE
ncbi:MAG TPA: hypothetical protein PKA63_01805 [Oligoflexia bacterium]|nr:hypothetical protein [Oligoflexia bacterium]HMP47385.1 hypothetical protein [Oligoflexia bacterium]